MSLQVDLDISVGSAKAPIISLNFIQEDFKATMVNFGQIIYLYMEYF